MIENRVTKIPQSADIKRVLVSVFDKTNLDILIRGLVEIHPDVLLYSTGGTYAYCEQVLGNRSAHNLKRISDYTGQPEMHGGLVKTLDFKIYLGLLSEPYNDFHREDLSRAGAVTFDMVVANLYPFTDTIAREDTDCENARSNIDIGGPCMIRAAAKNYIRTAAVCRPEDYETVLSEMKRLGGGISLESRFRLAVKAFSLTAAYDHAIAGYLSGQSAKDVAGLYELIDR